MGLSKLDEQGAVYPYLVFWIVVVFSALIWIVFNEIILELGSWHADFGSPTGFTWGVLVILCRATPVVILLGAFVWAVVQSHRARQVP